LNTHALTPTPTLEGRTVRLVPLSADVADDYWQMLNEPEGRRLTGTHATFAREQMLHWLATRTDAEGRADWAITRIEDGRFIGEVVLNDVDVDNRSAGFRISLAGPHLYGQGYGTDATRCVVDFGLQTVRLHRISLEVYDFNERAVATYRRCGFEEEGRLRDALLWDGTWHDAIVMSVLDTAS
jgi:RimJ/RimL family protein N-acetyltransferase